MAQWIEGHGIGWVVIDASPQSLLWKHNAQLLKIAESGRQGWSLAGHFPTRSARPWSTGCRRRPDKRSTTPVCCRGLAPRNVIGRQ